MIQRGSLLFSTLVFSALRTPSDIVLLIKDDHKYGLAEINIVNYLIIVLLCSMVVKENVKLLLKSTTKVIAYFIDDTNNKQSITYCLTFNRINDRN
jgi:hypothetical protein